MPHYQAEAGASAPPAHALPHQLPNARPAVQRGGLFSEPPRQAEPAPVAAPRSLFGIVTGALRGRPAPAPQAPAPQASVTRAEPTIHEQEPSATVRPAATDEVGLDIPAFLRRQSN